MQRKPIEKLERLLLDKTLDKMRPFVNFNRPTKGWIRVIRENLGMTVAQLARRVGLNQSRISVIEREEVLDSLTLKTLDNVAKALNCRLVYALIPEISLQSMIEKQAQKQVIKANKNLSHSMFLESQALDEEGEKDLLKIQVEEMLEKRINKIWEED